MRYIYKNTKYTFILKEIYLSNYNYLNKIYEYLLLKLNYDKQKNKI